MKKFLYIILIVVIGYFIFSFFYKSEPKDISSVSNPDIILFWGDGCPHCEDLEKYIKENQIDSVIKIERKEVWKNQANQKQMIDLSKKCPDLANTSQMGVPFAFIPNETKCFMGNPPIQEWIKSKLPTPTK